MGPETAHPPAPEARPILAADGVCLACRVVPARGPAPRANVVYLHGIQSHGGWYVDTAAELARRGYAVYLPDRRGSGRSGGVRGHFAGWDQLVDDVRRVVDSARRDAPERPVVLVGGCWGARPAMAFAARHEADLAGLALVCPAVKVKVDLPAHDKLRVVLGRAVSPTRPVRIPLTPEMFTSNPRWLEFVRTDPLSLRTVSARFFWETMRSNRFLARRARLSLPMLLLQSGADPIVDAAGVRSWFDGVAPVGARRTLYPTFGHILDFEEERRRYWDDLVGWLDATVAPAHRAPEASVA